MSLYISGLFVHSLTTQLETAPPPVRRRPSLYRHIYDNVTLVSIRFSLLAAGEPVGNEKSEIAFQPQGALFVGHSEIKDLPNQVSISCNRNKINQPIGSWSPRLR